MIYQCSKTATMSIFSSFLFYTLVIYQCSKTSNSRISCFIDFVTYSLHKRKFRPKQPYIFNFNKGNWQELNLQSEATFSCKIAVGTLYKIRYKNPLPYPWLQSPYFLFSISYIFDFVKHYFCFIQNS